MMKTTEEKYKIGVSCVFCASLNVIAHGTEFKCDNCGTAWGLSRRQAKRDEEPAAKPQTYRVAA